MWSPSCVLQIDLGQTSSCYLSEKGSGDDISVPLELERRNVLQQCRNYPILLMYDSLEGQQLDTEQSTTPKKRP